MKKFVILGILLCASLTVLAAPKKLINIDKNGTAIQGYDPVAYFTDSKPVKGDPKYFSFFNGARYYFASAEHKALFDREPAKYEPLYGGFCAYGASESHKAPINPEAWQVRNGKLILNYDQDVQKMFNQDPDGRLRLADQNWPGVVEKYGK